MKVVNVARLFVLMVLIQLCAYSIACFGAGDEDALKGIIEAAQSGDLAKVKAMVTDNPGLANAEGPHKITPLHAAVRKGHKEIAEYLIAQGADVNAKQAVVGLMPLHIAAFRDYRELVELLLAAGAEVNATENSGKTALHGAAHHGRKEMAQLLIAKGANINAKDDTNKTAADYALAQEHTEIVELLQSKGGKKGPLSVSAEKAESPEDIIELGKRLFGKYVIRTTARKVTALTGSVCKGYRIYNVTIKNPMFSWSEEETFPMAVRKGDRAFKLSNAEEVASFLGVLEKPVLSEIEALERTVAFAEFIGRSIHSNVPKRKSHMKEFSEIKAEDWPLVISRTDSGWVIFVTLVVNNPDQGVESCWRYGLEISKKDGMSVTSEKHVYQYAGLL
ncbi:MAG: ankyrin repeat domain-containing protein [Planctomycetota bacterium]